MSNVIPFPRTRAVFIWPAANGCHVGISAPPVDADWPHRQAQHFADLGIGLDHAMYLGEKSGLPIVSLREGF